MIEQILPTAVGFLFAGAVFFLFMMIYSVLGKAYEQYQERYVVKSMHDLSDMFLFIDPRQMLILNVASMCLLCVFSYALANPIVGVGMTIFCFFFPCGIFTHCTVKFAFMSEEIFCFSGIVGHSIVIIVECFTIVITHHYSIVSGSVKMAFKIQQIIEVAVYCTRKPLSVVRTSFIYTQTSINHNSESGYFDVLYQYRTGKSGRKIAPGVGQWIVLKYTIVCTCINGAAIHSQTIHRCLL